MELKEGTYLLYGKPTHQIIRMNVPRTRKERYYPVSMTEDLKYYTAQPVSMRARLCLFWSLWAMLVIAIVLSIIAYCCFIPQVCVNANKCLRANTTYDVNTS